MDAVLYIASAYLLADFTSGVFHWWEDRYGNPDWPLLGRFVVTPNIVHHIRPKEFCRGSYWYRNWTNIVPAIAIAAVAWACGHYFVGLVFLFVSQANEIHSWAHRRPPWVVRQLQRVGIMQSPRQHALHHRRPFDRNYCVMTNFVNHPLQAIGFWAGLEAFVSLCGISARQDRQEA